MDITSDEVSVGVSLDNMEMSQNLDPESEVFKTIYESIINSASMCPMVDFLTEHIH